jgi:hypothetical protein
VVLVVGMLIGIVLAALIALVLFAGGYDLKPKKLKFLLLDLEARRFIDLSPAKVFQSLSRSVIPRSTFAEDWLQGGVPEPEPLALIYLGWQLVCDSYLDRFGEYPSQGNVQARGKELGGQNIEFIMSYSAVYSSAVRNGDLVSIDFARDYFVRAPSLAERIYPDRMMKPQELFLQAAEVLSVWEANRLEQ